MPFTFTPEQRLTITRRQLNIQIENAGYAKTNSALSDQQIKLFKVDEANAVFYDFYNIQAHSYEDEARGYDGQVSNEYSFSDLDNAAKNNTSAPFFPSAENYLRFIPLIKEGSYDNVQIRGRFYPTGTDSRYETNILVNGVSTAGLVSALQYLTDPISGPGGTFQTASSLPVGAVSLYNVVINSIVQPYSSGDIILIYDVSGNSGLYKVINAFPPSGPTAIIQVDSIIPTLNGIASGANIIQDIPAFSPTERQNMSHVLYNEYLNNIGSIIIALVTEWQAKVNYILTQLLLQNDERATQSAQNTTALTNAQTLYNYLASWLALPYTGVTGKFTVSAINTLSTNITNRQSFITTRLAQITSALGSSANDSIFQSGDTYSTNVPGNTYYERYFWINVRINKLSGSLRRYYKAGQDMSQLNSLAANNIAIQQQYDQYFVTKRLMSFDGQAIAQLDSYTGFAPGDIVYLVSETKPELMLGVVELMGTNQVRFDKPIPNSYIKNDIARIFKLL